MKNLTITIADDVYRRARSKAAAGDTSVSRVVQDYLQKWTADRNRARLRADLKRMFAEIDREGRGKKGSVGPFSRAEIYEERLARFH